jgi:predicted lipoprotein with Yx(FWY)xxD motif
MKKRIMFAILVGALAGGSLAAGAVPATVKTATVGTLGTVVVSANGRTLYHYTDETKGKVDCVAACAKLWPPLLVRSGAAPRAGTGIAASKLGVLKRPDGTLQVTYGGLGLYLYAGDAKAGQAKGEGLESSWYAVSPAAKVVKPHPAAGAGGAGMSGTTTTPTSSGGGYGGYDSGY